MLNQAGLGIAFNAKRIVQENSKFSINQKRMDTILYLLGIKDEERAVAAQNRDFFTY
jgi:phosphoserine phosphatase